MIIISTLAEGGMRSFLHKKLLKEGQQLASALCPAQTVFTLFFASDLFIDVYSVSSLSPPKSRAQREEKQSETQITKRKQADFMCQLMFLLHPNLYKFPGSLVSICCLDFSSVAQLPEMRLKAVSETQD
ncbi:hypothetical protein INR49_009811 [Caranx melampygus]|nr:hypothetical protein INR49_009811 [Caranx melampygus]